MSAVNVFCLFAPWHIVKPKKSEKENRTHIKLKFAHPDTQILPNTMLSFPVILFTAFLRAFWSHCAQSAPKKRLTQSELGTERAEEMKSCPL